MSKKGLAAAVEEGKISLEELEGALTSLSGPVTRRVNALMNEHEKYLEAYKSYQAEVRAIEAKYAKEKFAALFDKRASIVSGKYEPTEAEAQYEGAEVPPTDDKDAEEEKGIPKYWLMALRNNNLINSQISEQDEEALAFLNDIRTSNFEKDGAIGFDLSFHFDSNPFFSDTVLTKNYYMEEEDMFGELVLKAAEGCKINWKPGKNLTVKTVKKKIASRGGRKGGKTAARSVTTEEPCESFFNFFSPPEIDDEEEVDGRDEEEMMAIAEDEERLEMDFDIASKLKDSIIPFSVLWFTGDAAEYDGYDEDDFDLEGMGGDDDDEEGEDEDDEDDDDDSPTKGRGGRGGRGGARGGRQGGAHSFAPPSGKQSSIPPPQQPECKQQ